MKNTLKLASVVFALIGLTSIAAQAQVLDGYAMTDPPKPPASPSTYVIDPNTAGADNVAATTGNSGTLATPLALGPGFSPDYNFRLGFSPNSGTYYATTLAAAKTAGDYLTFSISPTASGTALDLSSIDFLNGANSSGTGVDFITDYGGTANENETFTLESSANNYSSVLGSFSGSAFVGTLADSDLPIDLTNLFGTTTFRLYITTPNSATQAGETGLYRGTLDIDGTVVVIPEPGTYALLGLGLAGLVVTLRNRRSSRV